MDDSRNRPTDTQQQLSAVMHKYKNGYSQDADKLHEAIPAADMWQFFVEERVQRNGRGVSTFLETNDFIKYGDCTIAEYHQKKAEDDEEKYQADRSLFKSLGISPVKQMNLFAAREEIEKDNNNIDRHLNTDELS